MRPIFCGNLDFEARQTDLERLFRKYGKVERVDMKSGFAFIYMEDERDAKDAIRGLDRIEFGRKRRRLRVEWTKEERGVRRASNPKQSSGISKPSKTLFVINFDPYSTRSRDLERHFDAHGKVTNVRIRRNFAFIQFETQEDATRALEATDSSKLLDRVISVEYAIKDDDERRNGSSPDRKRDRSPGRTRERSLSPYKRERGSPDYGRGRSPSPYKRKRLSPDYGRAGSPSPSRRGKTNSDYGHRSRSRSRGRERVSPLHKREASPIDDGSPESGRASPIRKRVRRSPESGRASPIRERVRGSPGSGRASPIRERVRESPESGRASPIRERVGGSPEWSSPIRERVRGSPDDYHGDKLREDSPKSDGAASPAHKRYRSPSPLERERSRS